MANVSCENIFLVVFFFFEGVGFFFNRFQVAANLALSFQSHARSRS